MNELDMRKMRRYVGMGLDIFLYNLEKLKDEHDNLHINIRFLKEKFDDENNDLIPLGYVKIQKLLNICREEGYVIFISRNNYKLINNPFRDLSLNQLLNY